MILMEEIVARDAQYVDRLEEYNFPPTMGHAMRDRRYLLGRVRQLELALIEAQEWNWFDPAEIPGEVHQMMLDAMTPVDGSGGA